MRILKKISWQMMGVLLTLINIVRILGVLGFVFLALREFRRIWAIAEAVGHFYTVPTEKWIRLALFILGAIIMHFLVSVLQDAKERIKDNVTMNTTRYYSQQVLQKFKANMALGNTELYTAEEISDMVDLLKKRGENVYLNSNSMNCISDEGQSSDEEKLISTSEINGYIKVGVAAPMKELEQLLGLSSVKEAVRTFYNRYSFEQERARKGVYSSLSSCNHMCFYGPPGTGKTTVARIMSGILYELKIIKKNQVLEISGNTFKGQYVGETAKRTRRIIHAAKGGVLFVDEAYSLTEADDSYSREALAELMKVMEDDKESLVIIFAGYKNEMERFINVNPGMRSRIKTYIEFPNYTPTELGEIFASMARSSNYQVSDQLKEVYIKYAEQILLKQDGFSNAREVRNNLDEIIDRHANNYQTEVIGKELLGTLVIEDFPWFKKDGLQ